MKTYYHCLFYIPVNDGNYHHIISGIGYDLTIDSKIENAQDIFDAQMKSTQDEIRSRVDPRLESVLGQVYASSHSSDITYDTGIEEMYHNLEMVDSVHDFIQVVQERIKLTEIFRPRDQLISDIIMTYTNKEGNSYENIIHKFNSKDF